MFNHDNEDFEKRNKKPTYTFYGVRAIDVDEWVEAVFSPSGDSDGVVWVDDVAEALLMENRNEAETIAENVKSRPCYVSEVMVYDN